MKNVANLPDDGGNSPRARRSDLVPPVPMTPRGKPLARHVWSTIRPVGRFRADTSNGTGFGVSSGQIRPIRHGWELMVVTNEQHPSTSFDLA